MVFGVCFFSMLYLYIYNYTCIRKRSPFLFPHVRLLSQLSSHASSLETLWGVTNVPQSPTTANVEEGMAAFVPRAKNVATILQAWVTGKTVKKQSMLL